MELGDGKGLWEGDAPGDGLCAADGGGVDGQPAPLQRAGRGFGAGVMRGSRAAAQVLLQGQAHGQGGQALEEGTVNQLVSGCNMALWEIHHGHSIPVISICREWQTVRQKLYGDTDAQIQANVHCITHTCTHICPR